jgi:3',5'-cyclic AMP phosphodiesterase CpdA
MRSRNRKFVPAKSARVLLVAFAAAALLASGCNTLRSEQPWPAAAANTQPAAPSSGLDVRLPLLPKSVRFAVIGDSGTGDRNQYEVAQHLERYREAVGFDFVIMLGDNIYGGHQPKDFASKFEMPYKPLLDAGVKFYASLGNHDDPNQERLYKPFNMGGERYHEFNKGGVSFFALDSTYMDPKQLQWLRDNLQKSNTKWKICYFHHPLFNVGRAHGPDQDLRSQLTPIFQEYDVNVVFSGHEHVYERVKPQGNTYYFVEGSSGKLMRHDLPRSDQIQVAYDSDRGFMLVEIAGDELYFQAINQEGKTIDSGTLQRR